MEKILSIRSSIGGQALKIFFGLFLVGLFFSSIGLVNAACTIGTEGTWKGYGVGGNGSSPGSTCSAGTRGTPQSFNNTQSKLNGNTNFKSLAAAYGLTIASDCASNASVVQKIQQTLSSLGIQECVTCIDGKYGGHTESVVNNSLCRPECVPPDKIDVPSNGKCPDCYTLQDGCCIPKITPTTKITVASTFNDITKEIETVVNFGSGSCIDLKNKLYDCSKIIVDNVEGLVKWVLDTKNQCIASFKPKEAKDININVPESTMFYVDGASNVAADAIIKYGAGNNCRAATGSDGTGCIRKQICDCASNKKWDCASQTCICNNPPTNGACPAGQEIYDGCCIAKCDESVQKRDSKGKCVCNPDKGCCGIKLNTNVPFIGNCIEFSSSANSDGDSVNPDATTVNETTAFPLLMQGLMKILVTVILVASFIVLIAAGVMMSMSGDYYNTGKKMITGVIISLALLGASGVILRLVNPNFFG